MKEMANFRVAFDVFDGEKKDLPPGFQQISCHMMFDVKLGENFRRKAQYVAGGHVIDPLASSTNSLVVTRESIRIALLVAALNELEVLPANIQNAYLHAKCREKIWCKGGPEFGSDEGHIMIIIRALYGLKSSGAAFQSLLTNQLHDIRYTPTKGDPDVWIRPAVKSDGFEYYEMVLVYVFDIFAISDKPKVTSEQIQQEFKFKDVKMEPPDVYLGSTLENKVFNGVKYWTMTSHKYVNAAIENVEKKLADDDMRLLKRADTPMSSNYRPETDVSAELQGAEHTYFQELIGILGLLSSGE
jgi:Reverse transcriptase (RNA-dependent DNA polymerase)